MPLPSAMPFALDQYEARLHKFLQAQCYIHLGWTHDARVRDTGPWITQFAAPDGDRSQPYQWSISNYGLHGTVLIYYSLDVFRWMQERDTALCEGRDLATLRPIADGSMILKFMLAGGDNKTAADFPDMRNLPETAIAAIVKDAPIALMVKDAKGSKDGWFWGTWYLGTSAKDQQDQIDWPPPPNFPFPWMEAGNYCVNCHASARSEFTYSATSHVLGDPEQFPTFMMTGSPPILHATRPRTHTRLHHWAVPMRPDGITRVRQPRPYYPDTACLETFSAPVLPPMVNIFADTSLHMPPETYGHVVAGANGPAQFLTSDQCVGCHAAGATGLRFDMTVQTKPGGLLVNLAPYGEWRASLMGLAGRDPIFFSQLETERTVHAPQEKVIQDLCLHCHGAMGQRQFCMDQLGKDSQRCSNTGLLDFTTTPPQDRQLFVRDMLHAVPYKAVTSEQQRNAPYAALARDGMSCTVCHHVQIDPKQPFGDTFTGDFHLDKPDEVYGPFEDPKVVPMEQTLGITPKHDASITSSKICGSCHTVVLPVLDTKGAPWTPPGHTHPRMAVEQGTYVEWVFSAFRDDGAEPRSCQQCHMPKTYPSLKDELAFVIASIQQATSFPETENRRTRAEIDLPTRQGFARHTLVGLNAFLILMAQQFPDVLGIRVQDPMLTASNGIAPLATAYQAILEQAEHATATLTVDKLHTTDTELVADVTITSLVGHKFPSGVGFRRAFIEFAVLDKDGVPLWTSGRTNSQGVLIDAQGHPVRGEYFWKPACGVMTPEEQKQHYQPHFQEITRQDQVQIYQELTQDPEGKLTTSFLSIARRLKDNRLLPKGWDPNPKLAEREGLGSVKMPIPELIAEMQPVLPAANGQPELDPNFGGGGDTLTYRIPLASLPGKPASVKATLYYQAIPPFYLQDRFCTTGHQPDTQRLYAMAGYLQLDSTQAAHWKLALVSSGVVSLTQ
jgi:hypothetical protein